MRSHTKPLLYLFLTVLPGIFHLDETSYQADNTQPLVHKPVTDPHLFFQIFSVLCLYLAYLSPHNPILIAVIIPAINNPKEAYKTMIPTLFSTCMCLLAFSRSSVS